MSPLLPYLQGISWLPLYTDPVVRSISDFFFLSTIFCSLSDCKHLRQLPAGDRSMKDPHSGLLRGSWAELSFLLSPVQGLSVSLHTLQAAPLPLLLPILLCKLCLNLLSCRAQLSRRREKWPWQHMWEWRGIGYTQKTRRLIVWDDCVTVITHWLVVEN